MLKTTPLLILLLAGLALGCRRSPPVAPTAAAWLETEAVAQAAEQAPNTTQVGNLYRGVAHKKGEKTDWHVPLERGQCYWFSGVGDDTVEKLSLYLWNQKDTRMGTQKSATPRAVLMHCVEASGMYRVQAKVENGAGHYALAVFAMPAPEQDEPPPPPPPAEPAGPDLGAMVDAHAKSAAPGATRVGEHLSGAAEKTDYFTKLDAGTCYWFVGVGDTGVKKLYLYLWDQNNTRIGETRGTTGTTVFGHCPKASGMFKLQAKVDSGSGAYKVGVYAKTEGKSL